MKRHLGMLAATACAAAVASVAALAADQATLDRGKKAAQTGCVPCHSLRLVDSQRLSRATWEKELNKMAGFGWSATPADRAALLEYLVANFGNDRQPGPPEMSADGRGK